MYRARAADFGGFLVSTVGTVKYLIGTRGEIITLDKIKNVLNNPAYSNYHTNVKKYAYGNVGKIGADCNGWFEMFLNGGDVNKPLTKWKYPDTTANGVFAEAKKQGLPHGKISTLPRDCPYPIAVTYSGHVGYFYHGVVFQSAGHSVGTIKTELTDTRYNKAWQDWYMLPWLDYEGYSPGKGTNVAKNPYTEPAVNYPQGVTFRGTGASWFQWMLKKIGHNIAIDGIAGAQTWEALTYEMRQSGLSGDAGVQVRDYLKRVAAQMDAPTITVPPAQDVKERQIADLIQQNSDLLKKIEAIKKILG